MMTMPWGKFRGVRIDDVPSGYLAWVLEATQITEPHRTEIRDELADRLGLLHAGAVFRDAPPPELATTVAELIVAGFRTLSLKHHPDHSGGDGRVMQRLNDARAWCRVTGLAR